MKKVTLHLTNHAVERFEERFGIFDNVLNCLNEKQSLGILVNKGNCPFIYFPDSCMSAPFKEENGINIVPTLENYYHGDMRTNCREVNIEWRYD